MFRLRYDKKTDTIKESEWLDDDEVIIAEETRRFREIISVEEELNILRNAIMFNQSVYDLPVDYKIAVQNFTDAVTSRKEDKDAYLAKQVSLESTDEWQEKDVEKISGFLKLVGLTVPKVPTLSGLKNALKGKKMAFKKASQ